MVYLYIVVMISQGKKEGKCGCKNVIFAHYALKPLHFSNPHHLRSFSHWHRSISCTMSLLITPYVSPRPLLPSPSLLDGTSGTKEEKKAKEGKFFKQKMCWPITWLILCLSNPPRQPKWHFLTLIRSESATLPFVRGHIRHIPQHCGRFDGFWAFSLVSPFSSSIFLI